MELWRKSWGCRLSHVRDTDASHGADVIATFVLRVRGLSVAGFWCGQLCPVIRKCYVLVHISWFCIQHVHIRDLLRTSETFKAAAR